MALAENYFIDIIVDLEIERFSENINTGTSETPNKDK